MFCLFLYHGQTECSALATYVCYHHALQMIDNTSARQAPVNLKWFHSK